MTNITKEEAKAILNKVEHDGMSMREVFKTDLRVYLHYSVRTFYRARQKYLNSLPAPQNRLNFYITGRPGIGKGVLARALARSLFPGIEANSMMFYAYFEREIDNKRLLRDYDGQPVLIWPNCGSAMLNKIRSSKSDLGAAFELNPTTKCGCLVNTMNIVDSCESRGKFFDASADIRELFPFIFSLHEDHFDLFINEGYRRGNSTFSEQYSKYTTQANMGKLIEMYGGETAAYMDASKKVVESSIKAIQNARIDAEANRR